MRFIVCARSRQDGTVGLVSGESFPNRREAVEAIIASEAIDALLGADVFLVDLEAATPVALIPVGDAGRLTYAAPEVAEEAEQAESVDGAVASPDAEVDSNEEAEASDGDVVRVGSVEIDIEAWTCEDCIYVLTCEKSGTLRPAECGLFQWRA